ncbi:MAG: hypothetical protein E6G56_13605 [Actinobacteria bacterium]|nr:MAG: hypothetical protein E6G56_13605 [Actinomycetota bacterium]
MTLLLCWIIFPLLLGALALGCGLALEYVTGARLAGALVLPAGVAVIVVVAQLTTATAATAVLSTPLVVIVAIAGFVLSPPRRRGPVDRWAATVGVASYLVYLAPILLSGEATFAGYIKLDDTSTWLAITDRIMAHGTSLAGLAPSTYLRTLEAYVGVGYPVGSFLPWGVARNLVGQDLAWVFQPYLAFLGATLSLTVYSLVAPVVRARWLRATIAFFAAQPALLYGYSLWGGVKEMAGAALVALVAALVPFAVRERGRIGGILPLVIACVATLSALSYGGGVWLVPAVAPGLVAVALLPRSAQAAVRVVAAAAIGVVLAIPVIHATSSFLEPGLAQAKKSNPDLGNLVKPLGTDQIFGIWPTGDFRYPLAHPHVTHALIALLIAVAVAGIWWLWWQRPWGLTLYVASALFGGVVLNARASPWVGAKALASASPAVLTLGLASLAAFFEYAPRRWRALPALLGGVLVAGVAWSNLLAYHDVNLSPRERLAELQRIGDRFAGQGPALMTEYEPYGVRHFLRRMDAEGAGELRFRSVPLRNGQLVPKGGYADVDEFQLGGLMVYRTLVLPRSPAVSRPPSPYRLAWSGRYYRVWQRPEPVTPAVYGHLPLGNSVDPTGVASCPQILDLARLARARGGQLAAVAPQPPLVVGLSQLSRSGSWLTQGSFLVPSGAGNVDGEVSIDRTATYAVWVGGSVRDRLSLSVDGRPAGSALDQLVYPGRYTEVGELPLSAAAHRVTLTYHGPDLRPGSGGIQYPLGPLEISDAREEFPLFYLRPGEARRLCGRRLDWVEAISPTVGGRVVERSGGAPVRPGASP